MRPKFTPWSYHSDSSPGNGAFAGVYFCLWCVTSTAPESHKIPATVLGCAPSPRHLSVFSLPSPPQFQAGVEKQYSDPPLSATRKTADTGEKVFYFCTSNNTQLQLLTWSSAPFSPFLVWPRLKLAWRLAVYPFSVLVLYVHTPRYLLELRYVTNVGSCRSAAFESCFVR